MTTNTTSQAVSIDTPEFRSLCATYGSHWKEWRINYCADAMDELIAHIDAKLAQAREEGILFERKRLVQTIGNANDLSSECIKQRDEANARATAAESRVAIETKWATDMQAKAVALADRLAEIQRGVEGLRTYFIAAYSHPAYDPKFVALQDVIALLAQQGQADTSGLPG